MDDLFGAPVTPAPPPVAASTPGDGAREATPQSMDDLFGAPATKDPVPPAAVEVPPAGAPTASSTMAEPSSVEDLFGAPRIAAPAGAQPVPAQAVPDAREQVVARVPAPVAEPPPAKALITGFYQNELAYTYQGREHWSKFRNTLDLSSTGRMSGGIPWKLGARLTYDPIYDLTDYYNRDVRRDQRLEADIREAYVDVPAGEWEFRLGRQHVVWGEMVGLFFADVVSAKDLRELALQEFDLLRIPQWAARAEYFRGDFHAEGVWIPYMSYDNIGKPGAEFYPFVPPAGVGIAKERKPVGLDDAAYGLRLSYLQGGWDLSGFYYTANDASAAFALLPALSLYQPIHERIHQWGATLGKDLGPLVLKAEAVYTQDKLFNVTRLSDADGLVQQDLLDYIIGLEWSFPEETRFNVQFFQRWFPDRDPDIGPEETESGVSLLLSSKALHPKVEPKLLLIRSLNRDDWLTQFKVTWTLDGNWRLAAGADVFVGPRAALFGQFDDKDRVYTEVRYSF